VLTDKEQLRYSRQIMLKRIGLDGQLALKKAKVLIVGMGGLGNPVALYLAAAGVGNLYLADGDHVDLTNLQRQVLFNERDIGSNKADIAKEKLLLQNSELDIEVIDEMLDMELCQYYLSQLSVDLVIDCSDNLTTRYMVNQACFNHKVPLIIGAATGFDGQHLVLDARDQQSACYQCLFPASEKAPAQNCQSVGIMGPVLAIVAGMQSLSALKLLTNNPPKINQLSLFDGLTGQWQQFSLKKRKNCPVCQSAD
jgi:molybdopterin/thiamine biosynthesis adenylyltransferase